MKFAIGLVATVFLIAIPIQAIAQQQWNDDCAQPGGDALLARGCAVLDEFMKTFNARDAAMWAKTLNYPHVRVAVGEVFVWNNPSEFQSSLDFAQFAAAAGWVRSVWDWRRLVQKSPDKLHFLVQFTRYGEGDRKIASFESLYIITLKDGHWGVQARSSFDTVKLQ